MDVESKLSVKKNERGKRRWCVLTEDGMMKCFNCPSEANKYKRKMDFWHKEKDYSIQKRNQPWLKYRASKEIGMEWLVKSSLRSDIEKLIPGDTIRAYDERYTGDNASDKYNQANILSGKVTKHDKDTTTFINEKDNVEMVVKNYDINSVRLAPRPHLPYKQGEYEWEIFDTVHEDISMLYRPTNTVYEVDSKDIEGEIEPGERRTYDYPGSPASLGSISISSNASISVSKYDATFDNEIEHTVVTAGDLDPSLLASFEEAIFNEEDYNDSIFEQTAQQYE